MKRFDWFIERIQTRVASAEKNFMPEELSRNQSTLRFDVILQLDWPIEQCLLRMRFSLAGKRRVYVLIFSSIG